MNKLKNTQLMQVKVLISEIIEEAENKRTSWKKIQMLVKMIEYKAKTYDLVIVNSRHVFSWMKGHIEKRYKEAVVYEAGCFLEEIQKENEKNETKKTRK